jgi:hypothetical protein
MDFDELTKQALLILDQERITPTLGYTYIAKTMPANAHFYLAQQGGNSNPILVGMYALTNMRKQRPREVWEKPAEWQFASRNYDLLMLILQQLNPPQKTELMLKLITTGLGAEFADATASRSGHGSCFCLLAEVCFRNGYFDLVIGSASTLDYPTVSVAAMVAQMEEIVALNFDVFSKSELEKMPSTLSRIRDVAEVQTWQSRHHRGKPASTKEVNSSYKPGYSEIGRQIVASIDGLLVECKRALYLNVEGILRQSRNPEIESDKVKVESYLQSLGFGSDMIGVLNAAESDYRAIATQFELKNCLSHLRSFLEHLHRESAKAIADTAGETVTDRWGDATLYLRQKNIFTKQHEAFSASLYTLISDESVHPLGADREYARLLRNVVIEYGVMFLSTLDSMGIRIP